MKGFVLVIEILEPPDIMLAQIVLDRMCSINRVLDRIAPDQVGLDRGLSCRHAALECLYQRRLQVALVLDARPGRCACGLHGRRCRACTGAALLAAFLCWTRPFRAESACVEADSARRSAECRQPARAVLSAAHHQRRSERQHRRQSAPASAARRSRTARIRSRQGDMLERRCTRRGRGSAVLRRGCTGARVRTSRRSAATLTWAGFAAAPPEAARRHRRRPPSARPISDADSAGPCSQGQARMSRGAAPRGRRCSRAPHTRPCRRASPRHGRHGCRPCT